MDAYISKHYTSQMMPKTASTTEKYIATTTERCGSPLPEELFYHHQHATTERKVKICGENVSITQSPLHQKLVQ